MSASHTYPGTGKSQAFARGRKRVHTGFLPHVIDTEKDLRPYLSDSFQSEH